ncbi:RAM signaling network component [Elasticomyces elasticus]|nr:RAM signaling network component [Elasticomyces elasticus]
MADPVTIALKGAGTAFAICEATYKLIQGIKKAPKDITRVATDLESFYGILGALQGFIETQRSALNKPGPAAYQLQNITSLIDNCVAAFQEVQQKIQDFIALNGKVISGLSKAFKWELFRREDVHYLGEHLSNMKLGLNLALTSLTWLVATETHLVATNTHNEVLAIRRDISHLQEQLKSAAVQDGVTNDLPDRASMVSVASCLSFASTASFASSRQSIALFVAETEDLVDGLDNDELLAVASPNGSPATVSELVAFTSHIIETRSERQSKSDYLTADLGSKNIQALPLEVVALIKDSVVHLSLRHNALIAIPSEIVQCHRLTHLWIPHNQLEQFPDAVLQLSRLEMLDLGNNRIPSIPEGIKNMTSLRQLEVYHNKIARLPLAMGDMSNLEGLIVEDNPLEFPPIDALPVSPTKKSSWDRWQHAISTRKVVKQYLRDAARMEYLESQIEEGIRFSGLQ